MNRLSRHLTGSRFDGRATASLHGHRRRASPQDDNGSVLVGVHGEAATRAGEVGLALAARAVDGSAVRTGLRTVGWIDLYKRPAALFYLVRQFVGEGGPSLIEDGAIQPALAASAGSHARHVQILEHGQTETLGDVPGNLVLPVGADTSDAAGQTRDTTQALEPAPGRPLAPRQRALSSAAALVDRLDLSGKREGFTVEQRERDSNAAIDADRRVIVRGRLMFDFAGEADVPSERVADDGGADHASNDRPASAEFDPAEVRETHRAPPSADDANSDFLRLETEAVVDAFAARRGEACTASEEAGERLVEVAQRLMQAGTGDRGDPVDFPAKRGDLSPLGGEIEVPSGGGSVLPPEVAALFQGQIVDEPSDADELSEGGFLFGRRRQPKAECALDHNENTTLVLATPQLRAALSRLTKE